MNIIEFFNKYSKCPLCHSDLKQELIVYLEHANFYILVNKFFIADKTIAVLLDDFTPGCDLLPNTFPLIADGIILPNKIKKMSYMNQLPDFGNIELMAYCLNKDEYTCHSTSALAFNHSQKFDTSHDSFALDFNKKVYNDYKREKSMFLIPPNTFIERGLIPMEKWSANDKSQIIEKFDKLLLLI